MSISNMPGGTGALDSFLDPRLRALQTALPNGMELDPNNPDALPTELRALAEPIKQFLEAHPEYGDTIDTTGEFLALREHLERLIGTPSTAPAEQQPAFSADMLQALIQWLASGGSTRRSNAPAQSATPRMGGNGNFAQTRPTSWNPSRGGGGGGGGHTTHAAGSTANNAAPATPGEAQTVAQMKERTPPDIRARAEAVDPSQISHYDKRSPKAQWAARVAVAMGLRVTDVTDGRPGDGIHSNSSLHYDENDASGRIRAIDVGGSSQQMTAFYDVMRQVDPGSTELFYDPRGGIKHGNHIGAIGGHGNHVHYGAA